MTFRLPLETFFASLPEPFAGRWDEAAPWSLLDGPLDELLAGLPSSRIEAAVTPEVHLLGDRIVIGAGTRILPGAVIEGPIWIGQNVEIRPGAYLRGGVYLGDGAVVGTNTEVKRAIFLPGAKAPHLSYVGDSILGAKVNLGAGTVLSNFRHDGDEIRFRHEGERVATGRRKLGAILGDGVSTGCNSVLHPGCLVGRECLTYPGVQLRAGVYPPRLLIKLKQDLELVPRG